MKLTWNGHSCFTLEAEEGTLVLDPYGDGQVPGLAPLRLTAQQKDRLHRVDVLMLPVGGYCTISAHEARTLATPLFPRIIIPMHYRSATSGYRFGYDELGLLGNFTAVCPRESLVYYKGSTMEITKHTPGQTAILTYCPG